MKIFVLRNQQIDMEDTEFYRSEKYFIDYFDTDDQIVKEKYL